MDKFNKQISFRKTERITLSILIVLVVISYSFNLYFKPKFPEETAVLNLADIISKVDVDSTTQFIRKAKKKKSKYRKTYKESKVKLVPFDPNNTDSLMWIQLGLKPWTIANIKKYQAKGGQFYDCQDLEKIYSLKTETYQAILPYCKLSKSKPKPKTIYNKKPKPVTSKSNIQYKSKEYPKSKKKPRPIVDINTADTTAFQSLYGIGAVLSKRIVAYRTGLGGFLNLDQLTEVYGVEKEVLDNNNKRLTITTAIRKLNVNQSADTLARHPYIKWKLAKVIANYRKHHGDYKSLEDIKKVRVINDSMYNRMLPYLTTQ